MLSKWHRFRRLNRFERRVFAEALVALWLASWALRWSGFHRCQSVLARIATRKTVHTQAPSDALLEKARLMTMMVQRAARFAVCPTSCLSNSLVLWFLLNREGIGSDLRVGVRKETSDLEAHAWVECLGHVLNDGPDVGERFAGFDRAFVPARSVIRRRRPSLC